MSGHSKWHSIKHKKGAADAKRGALFTKLSKNITLAARDGGGDIEMNSSLRMAIDKAKQSNMPKTNIERAIKKGTGELNDGAILEEITYEGYGPSGVAIMVHCITDNKNRTISNVRHAFTSHGGSMGEPGSVAWMFEQKGEIEINLANNSDVADEEALEMMAIEAGAEDIEKVAESVVITTNPKGFHDVKKYLEDKGVTMERAELTMQPNDVVTIEDVSIAKKISNLLEALDEDEDVSDVHTNFDVPEELMSEL